MVKVPGQGLNSTTLGIQIWGCLVLRIPKNPHPHPHTHIAFMSTLLQICLCTMCPHASGAFYAEKDYSDDFFNDQNDFKLLPN